MQAEINQKAPYSNITVVTPDELEHAEVEEASVVIVDESDLQIEHKLFQFAEILGRKELKGIHMLHKQKKLVFMSATYDEQQRKDLMTMFNLHHHNMLVDKES